MAWCRSGDKPLSEPMGALFGDAYISHSASMIKFQTSVYSSEYHETLLSMIKTNLYPLYNIVTNLQI